MILNDIKKMLVKQPIKRLAQMYCEINSWKWPSELKKFKPEKYEAGNQSCRFGIAIMDMIKEIIGDKTCSREWNRKTMTNEQFERWYGKTHD